MRIFERFCAVSRTQAPSAAPVDGVDEAIDRKY